MLGKQFPPHIPNKRKILKITTQFIKKLKKMNEFYFLTINEHKKTETIPELDNFGFLILYLFCDIIARLALLTYSSPQI